MSVLKSTPYARCNLRMHSFLAAVVVALFACIALAGGRKPNFIIVFVDDLGYADIEPFGSKANRTPNLSRMAKEGMCFTDFYVSASVCSPSRASLMTGSYPLRVDLHDSSRGVYVLCPMDQKGINPSEITIAETLESQGYATACIGKWHLGDQDVFLPTRHGFDFYYGIPYSNDMNRKPKAGHRRHRKNHRPEEAGADQGLDPLKRKGNRHPGMTQNFVKKSRSFIDNPVQVGLAMLRSEWWNTRLLPSSLPEHRTGVYLTTPTN